jgi:acyl-coenzyme A synthetase/AMP-(fatty) acid ligase
VSAAGAAGNVIGLFAAAAERRGGAPAIMDADGCVLWSFGDLAHVAARVASGLAGNGVGPGHRVLVLERDPRRRFAVVAGILWAGATVAAPPTSPSGRAALDAALLTRPTAVAFGPRLWPVILGYPRLRAIPLRIVTCGPRPLGTMSLADLARGTVVPPRVVAGDVPALASFTTGSLGPPQLVLRSHDLLRAQHDALGRLRALTDGDRDLVGLPFLALHDLASGVTCVLPPPDPGSTWFGARVRRAVTRAGATSAAGFPHLFEAAAERGAGGGLRSLRAIHVGGSRVSAGLLGSLTRAAPHADVTVVYGSTEVEPIAAIPAGEYLDALAGSDPDQGICAGRVIPGLDLRVAPPDRLEGDRSGVGEVQVRGPRAAAESGAGGWVATGDAGRLADDGRLWLLGRTGNAVDGRYPFQVERAVETLDWVGRAALVRVGRDPDAGGALVVEPRRWDPRAVMDWASSIHRLAGARGWPIDDVRLVRELPVIPGPAAKTDTLRLARSVARHRRAARGSARWTAAQPR